MTSLATPTVTGKIVCADNVRCLPPKVRSLWREGSARSVPLARPMSPASPASVISPIAREHGQVDAHNPSVLKEAGNDAMRARDWKRGMHMFTVGIDMITDSSPPSDAAGWFALDVKSKGLLHLLYSNRSLAHLNLGDTSAAIQDAEVCCSAATRPRLQPYVSQTATLCIPGVLLGAAWIRKGAPAAAGGAGGGGRAVGGAPRGLRARPARVPQLS